MLNWKKLSAEDKILVLNNKKEEWKKFASTINITIPSSIIFEKIHKIKGPLSRKINILCNDNRIFSTTSEIANEIAQSFSNISSTSHYSDEFKILKNIKETYEIIFFSANKEDYNKPFNIHAFEQSLSKFKDTSSEPDEIHYKMIKSMPDDSKNHVLSMINKFWITLCYLSEWQEAIIIIPIPEPGKDHSRAINYRPIALTSCLGTTVERMINRRLPGCEWLDKQSSMWMSTWLVHH